MNRYLHIAYSIIIKSCSIFKCCSHRIFTPLLCRNSSRESFSHNQLSRKYRSRDRLRCYFMTVTNLWILKCWGILLLSDLDT